VIAESADRVGQLPPHLRDLDHLPAVLSAEELALLLRIGRSHFYKQAKRGVFDFLQVKPITGPKAYSGTLVSRYLKGESVYVPSFGRKHA
jgi:hypothetical protein